MYDAATSECFSFVLAIKISQKTDHHSKRNPPGASIAEKTTAFSIKTKLKPGKFLKPNAHQKQRCPFSDALATYQQDLKIPWPPLEMPSQTHANSSSRNNHKYTHPACPQHHTKNNAI